MKATASTVRISPRKLNLIARLVRNKDVSQALNILRFTPKKSARLLYKVLNSAVANAENNFKQERETLFVKEVVVTKATTMKRSVPISRGRVYPILKRNAHVSVMIGVKAASEMPKTDKAAKTETAAAETKAAPKKTAKAKAAAKTTKATKKA